MIAIFFLLSSFNVFAESLDLSFKTTCSDKNNEATISFVGDILIHKALYKRVVSEKKRFSQLWENTDKLIQKANFSVANLEGPAAMGIDQNGRDRGDIGFVYDGEVYSGTNFVFNYHPRILLDLKNSGYDLLTVANNHSLDRFAVGINKTIEAAQDVGMFTVGIRTDEQVPSPFYKIVKINHINVAFLGCTEMTNGRTDRDKQVMNCYQAGTVDLIKNLDSNTMVDAIIVMPHWGEEYSHTPNARQKQYARKFLEAGATAVVGSHPHVLQPWEKYTTSDGREGIIVYSLGNFVAGQAGPARRTGAVFYLGLSKKENLKASVFGSGYTPTFRTDAKVNPVGKNGNADVLNHTKTMFGSKSRIEPDQDVKTKLCLRGLK